MNRTKINFVNTTRHAIRIRQLKEAGYTHQGHTITWCRVVDELMERLEWPSTLWGPNADFNTSIRGVFENRGDKLVGTLKLKVHKDQNHELFVTIAIQDKADGWHVSIGKKTLLFDVNGNIDTFLDEAAQELHNTLTELAVNGQL